MGGTLVLAGIAVFAYGVGRGEKATDKLMLVAIVLGGVGCYLLGNPPMTH